MPTKKPPSTDIKDFPVFGQLSEAEYNSGIVDLLNPIEHFSSEVDIDWKNIQFNKDCVADIVDLVHRRRIYFHIYHDIEMGELNEACLICFWVLKLSPFYDQANPNRRVNLVFALSLFTRAVAYAAFVNAKPLIPLRLTVLDSILL